MSNYPKVEIEDLSFEDSVYVREDFEWDAETLVKFANKRGYPIFTMPLAGISLENMPFSVNNLTEFIFQVNRMNKVSLDYPIILDDNGFIADGWHRVCKAIIEGKVCIKAIRLQEMPEPDRIIKEE